MVISTDGVELDPPQVAPSSSQDAGCIGVYMLELWSFIPYYVAALSAALGAADIRVTLGSPRYHLDRRYFEKAGVGLDTRLIDFGGSIGNKKLRRLVKAAEYILNLCLLSIRFSVKRPSILHVQFLPFLDHGSSFELWFLRFVKRLRIRIVHTAHNVTHPSHEQRNRDLYARLYHLADLILCHGEKARAQLQEEFSVFPSKIRVVPHGPLFQQRPDCSPFDARRRLGIGGTGPLVVCAGVIDRYKGIPLLLRAWARVTRLGSEGKLLVAGTGDPRLIEEIRGLAASLHLGSSLELRLAFIPVEKLPLVHHAADILVYPYSAGTTSGALLTGMQYEKAIVATELPLFQEHLRNGQSALLVPSGDEAALAEALARLLDDPPYRKRLAASLSKNRVAQSSWAAIARQTIDCYREVLLPEWAPVRIET